jgi:CRP-like cAMP-binding protein
MDLATHADHSPAAGTHRDRALMVCERERLAALADVAAFARLDRPTMRELARLGRDEAVDGRAVVQPGSGEVFAVREGELLVVCMEPVAGAWTDEDGLTRDARGARVALDPVTGGRVVGRVGPGELFGDSLLVADGIRGATLRATSSGVRVVAFDATALHLQLARTLLACPDIAHVDIDEQVDARRLGLYNDLPIRDLAAVLEDGRQERFRPGDAIVTRGDHGDRFYVLLAGSAVVERDGTVLARLGSGDHFGELALLSDAPRAATVRATDRTLCWSVTRTTFERILRHRLTPEADLVSRDLVSGTGPGGAWGSALAGRLRDAR